MKKFQLFIIIPIVLFASTALALTVDFTNSSWQPANGQNSYSVDYGSLTVTATASPWNKTLTYDTDGMGVQDDEISAPWFGAREMITLSFSESVYVSGFIVADLFEDELWDWDEQGGYDYTPGGNPTIFGISDGIYDPVEGALTYSFGSSVLADTFTFFGVKSAKGWKDFSVNSIMIDGSGATPVPEPASMLLLGAGLVGIAGFGRKKLHK
jgi:hypothetical protein